MAYVADYDIFGGILMMDNRQGIYTEHRLDPTCPSQVSVDAGRISNYLTVHYFVPCLMIMVTYQLARRVEAAFDLLCPLSVPESHTQSER